MELSQELEEIETKKFNSWGLEKKPLGYDLISDNLNLRPILLDKNIPNLVKDAIYFHKITNCLGFEFYVYSNTIVNGIINLSNEFILCPCFYNDTELDGKSLDDPIFQQTYKMQMEGQFIYDGWINVNDWNEINIESVVQSISETLALFSLEPGICFYWGPKYRYLDDSISFYSINSDGIIQYSQIFSNINKYPEVDKRAIYRSLSWYSQAKKVQDPISSFLYFILAIESLANYIEKVAKEDSPLICLRAGKITSKEEKRKCIEKCLASLEENPTKAIENAYFNCNAGIKKTIKNHLIFVVSDTSEIYELLLKTKINGETLYDLRSKIAHGNVDLITEKDKERIIERLWDVERICPRYFFQCFTKLEMVPPIEQ